MTMGTPDRSTRDLVQQTWQRVADVRLTPSQAKLYSHHILLGLGRPGVDAYTQADTVARLDEAQLLLESARLERAIDPGSTGWRHAAKRAAELLEWLAHDGVAADDFPAAVLSAAAYQLAGYPARALGLLAHGTREVDREVLLGHFLRADFPSLLVACQSSLAGESAP